MEKLNKQKPTIKLSEEIKKKLDKIKLVPSETYEHVIIRLLGEVSK